MLYYRRVLNDNLEAIAQAVYEELIQDESNQTGGKIIDLAETIVCGKTPSTKDPKNFQGSIPFITIPDMHEGRYCIKTERSLSRMAASNRIPANSICVSCIASAGLVCICEVESQTNQQINSIVCKPGIDFYFVYFKMKELSGFIRQIGSCGSTTCNLSKSEFSNIDIKIPSISAQADFSKKVTPLFNQIRENQKEIIALEKLKSVLLSKISQ